MLNHGEARGQDRTHRVAVVILTVVASACLLLAAAGRSQNDVLIIGADDAGTSKPVRAALPDDAADGVPVGTVVAWMKAFTNTPALPAQWVECNGQVLDLPGSPYDGGIIPNLNGSGGREKRFLRGSDSSGATGGAETHGHGLYLINRSEKKLINVSARNDASNLPPYYEVVWIMKVQ